MMTTLAFNEVIIESPSITMTFNPLEKMEYLCAKAFMTHK